MLDVAPHLRRDKRDKQTENNAERRQHSRGEPAKMSANPPPRQYVDRKKDGRSHEITNSEDNERHPEDRKIVQPIAHGIPRKPDRFALEVRKWPRSVHPDPPGECKCRVASNRANISLVRDVEVAA